VGPASGAAATAARVAERLQPFPSFLPPSPCASRSGIAMSGLRAPRGVPAAPGCLLLLGLLLVGAAAAECELEAADVPGGRRGARGSTTASSSSSSAADSAAVVTGNGSARNRERAPAPRCPPCLPACPGAARSGGTAALPLPGRSCRRMRAGSCCTTTPPSLPAELGGGSAGPGGAVPPEPPRLEAARPAAGTAASPPAPLPPERTSVGSRSSTENLINLFIYREKSGGVPTAVLVASGNACTQSAVAVKR